MDVVVVVLVGGGESLPHRRYSIAILKRVENVFTGGGCEIETMCGLSGAIYLYNECPVCIGGHAVTALEVLDIVVEYIRTCDIPAAKSFARHGLDTCKAEGLVGTDVHLIFAVVYATIVACERWSRVGGERRYRIPIRAVNVRPIVSYIEKRYGGSAGAEGS